MGERPPSLQEIIRRRQRGDFVGREQHRTAFRENFGLSLADRKFVYSVHGQAGIGKTYLLGQLRTIASETGSLVTVTDDNELDLVSTMMSISRQLAGQGSQPRHFPQRLEQYRRRHDELLMDPEAPPAARELLTSATVRMTMSAVKTAVPGLGALADAFTPEDIADRVEKSRGFLSSKFKNHADVRLVLSPVEELTPLFVEDLRDLARHRQPVLMFDTFERTSAVLEQWLLRVLSEHYGELPANLILVIVGQQPLDRNLWDGYSQIIEDWPLEPFTDAEARTLLERRGVRDERVIEVIQGLSGGLPLLVAMLAEKGPQGPDEIGDPSGSAVERFLKWESQPQRREDALLGALPRGIDEDVLSVLVGQERAADVLERLRGLPFVTEQSGKRQYHQVVREQMVRLQRTRSPQRFAERHRALAEHHRAAADRVNAEQTYEWADDVWRECTLERVYHLLCADPNGSRAEALYGAARATAGGIVSARRWASMIEEAGRDTDTEELRRWGSRLSERLQDETSLTDYLTLILNEAGLKGTQRVQLLRRRGISLIDDKAFDAALTDLNDALEIEPESVDCRSWRGTLHRLRDENAPAVADLTFALEAEPDRDFDWAERGVAHANLGDLDAAMADLSHAISLDPAYTWAMYWLSHVHERRGELREALAVLDRAIGVSPDASLHVRRGQVLGKLKEFTAALESHGRAIELSPDDEYGWQCRGFEHMSQGNLDEALADLTKAIELAPADALGYRWRGMVLRRKGLHQEALADLDHALGLVPNDHVVWTVRGRVHLATGDFARAEADFDEALRLEPKGDWALSWRAEARLSSGQFEAALADLDEAIGLDPEFGDYYHERAEVQRVRGEYVKALVDCERALELLGSSSEPLFRRGRVYRSMDEVDKSLADFTSAIEQDPTYEVAYLNRMQLRADRGDLVGARADADRLVELDPEDATYRANRAIVLQQIGDLPAALTDSARACELEPDGLFHRYLRAALRLVTGDLAGAEAEFRELCRIDDQPAWSHYCLGLVSHVREKDPASVREHFARALEFGTRENAEDPSNPTASFNLALYRIVNGDYAGAAEAVRDTVRRRTLLEHRADFRRDSEQLRELIPDHAEAVDEVLALLP